MHRILSSIACQPPARRRTVYRTLGSALLALTALCGEGGSAEERTLPPRMPAPNYPLSYPPASQREITEVVSRIRTYLEEASPLWVRDEATGARWNGVGELPVGARLERGDFPLVSYEWGVTYSGMLELAETTGDVRFSDYVGRRLELVRRLGGHHLAQKNVSWPHRYPMRTVIDPQALDDSGSMAAAMIRAERAGVVQGVGLFIERYLRQIVTEQKRLPDGTLARDRPMPDSLWLDDLYMSVPALAQMGMRTGDGIYFAEAVKQVQQIAARLYLPERRLFRHGWVQSMDPHPSFLWGRANGWAAVTLVELLSVLPDEHPGRAELLSLYRDFMAGLVAVQGVNGRWHQLLDRPETYEETSCTAMFVYALARGINRGWLDPLAYGPAASVGWSAVSRQVNAQGQVEGVCIGTGMAWEPVFYAHRPTSVYAAHGYGPTLLAAAEMLRLRRGKGAAATVHDEGIHFGVTPQGNY